MEYADYLSAMQNQIAEMNSFNATQALHQRNWEEKMSNSAHQREVADLVAAGLNPVLSARNQGASTPSGASASDSSSVGAMAQMLSTILDTENANARAMLSLASRGAGGSTSAQGNGNFISNLLMALGMNRNQAQGIENTLNELGFSLDTVMAWLGYAKEDNAKNIEAVNKLISTSKSKNKVQYLTPTTKLGAVIDDFVGWLRTGKTNKNTSAVANTRKSVSR